MAIYFLAVKSFGRSAGTGGSVSTSAAAYRSGERIRDERTGRVYDHTQRRDVEYKEILLPAEMSGDARLDWARNRSELWNRAERAETRINARVAREYIVALPYELSTQQRWSLARSFAQEISDRYYNVVDLAVHQPRTDPRNFHAHLLTTTREIGLSGLGAKTTAELTGSQRFELGLPRAMHEHGQIRERWAQLANGALHEAGLETRISHVPDPTTMLAPDRRPWLPRVAWEIERRGGHSILGDRARAEFADRRAAMAQAPQHPEVRVSGLQILPESRTRMSPDELRVQAIREWRAIRAELAPGPSSAAQASLPRNFRDLDPQPDVERQVSSLRRELGRDDLAL